MQTQEVPPLTVDSRARRIRLVLLDVDGVLSDGTVILDASGAESKGFNIKDGAAIVWALSAGLTVGLLSSRKSGATAQRAVQLGIPIVAQGIRGKAGEYERIRTELGLAAAEVAYMGDDLVDLPVMRCVGLSGAPSDAAPEVLDIAHWVSRREGGRGAVREFLEVIMKAQGLWRAVMQEFSA